MLLARLKRWWYLLTRGMWRGECAISTRDDDNGLVLLASGTPQLTNIKIWWRRNGRPPNNSPGQRT